MSGSGEGGGAGVTFPLSEHQLVMWLDERLHPGTTPNNISQALRPHEWLDPPVLRAALHRLIERHPQLRITVHEVDGVPVQTVGPVPAADDPAGHPVLAEVDARGWSDDDVASWFADESFRPFDLTVGPPIRFTLLRRSEAEQVFVGVIHHIVADLWSLAILAQEVAALYRHEQGRGEEPPGPRSTYRDFVDRQRALLSSGAGDELRDFWAGLLADSPDPLALPSERAGPSSSGRAASVSLQLDRATTARLRHLAAESGTTMFAVTLAGFAALLHRTTDRDDLLIATNRANRTARSARVVGCYTNVLLLRSRMADDPSFAELVASTAGVVRDAFQHGAYPYRGALGLLRAGGRGAEAAGAQVAFSWQKTTRRISSALSASMATNTPMSGELADGFGVDVAGDSRRSTGFELSVVAAEVDDRVTFAFEFQVERFDSATIQRMASQLGADAAAATWRTSATTSCTRSNARGWPVRTASITPQRASRSSRRRSPARPPTSPSRATAHR